jgi:peptidoglycan/LPS O-acetylase OafA/YrhL
MDATPWTGAASHTRLHLNPPPHAGEGNTRRALIMQTSGYRLGYRSDIEGLRAVAILLVVAAHARIAGFAGGFVGVDVFFVLSGYLITGLLVQEIQQNGKLKFADFYARRLRRLLPGLLLMLAATAVLGRLFIAPGEQPEQATAAATAALWISNFFFAFEHLDYFSPGSETNLFLHTWSLGVEEQFYLVWPLLLALVIGAWAGAYKPRNSRRVKMVMPIIFVASLAVCAAWTRRDPPLAFYMMPTRAWQFALGALVFAYFHSPATSSDDTARSNRKFRAAPAWLGWIGLTMILASAILLSPRVTFPWPWAVIPSLGAAAILAAGARASSSGAGKLLSIRPLQSIGGVSYSWYLWHWPVLLLGAALIDIRGIVPRLALVAVSYACATLAYHYVETPIRRNPRMLSRPRTAIAAAVAIMIACNALGLRWHNAARDRMVSPEQLPYQQVRVDAPIIYDMGCDDWYRSADVKLCAFGPADALHTAVAIGDSVALQWFPAYLGVFAKPGWRLLVATKSSCPMVDEPFFYQRIGREFSECSQWRRDALNKIAALKPDVVILGSTYTSDFTQAQWIEGTARVLQPLAASSGRVYIIRSTPVLPFDGPSCLEPRSWLYSKLSVHSSCVAPAHNALSDNVYLWLEAAANRFSNVTMLDMTDAICPNGQCRAERDGTIVFRDTQHLATRFAESLSNALAHALSRDPVTTMSGAAAGSGEIRPSHMPQ